MSDDDSTFDAAIIDGLDGRYGRGRGRLIVLAALHPGADAYARWAMLETFGDAIVSEPKDKRGFGYARHHHLATDLDHGATWTGRSLILHHELPDTILDAVVGQPLSTIVSHDDLPADAIVQATTRRSSGTVLHTGREVSFGIQDVSRRGPVRLFDAMRLMTARARFNVEHGIALGPSRMTAWSAALGACFAFCAVCLVHLFTYPVTLLFDPSGELGGKVVCAMVAAGVGGAAILCALAHMLSTDIKGFDRVNAEMVERFGRWTI